MFDFLIHFRPCLGEKGYSISVDVSNDFVEFARTVNINQQSFESEGLRLIEMHWRQGIVEDFKRGGVCLWDGGLLERINLPGNACGLALEQREKVWRYVPENMDTSNQALVVFGLLSKYQNALYGKYVREKR